jgi:HD domain
VRPRAPWLLIACVVSAAVITYVVAGGRLDGNDWLAVLAFAAFAAGAERLDINLYGDGRVSISALFMLTAAVTLGPGSLLVICPLVGVAGHLGRGRPLYKLAFNIAVFLLSGLASAYVYRLGVTAGPGGRPFELGVVMAAAVANFAVNSVLIAAAIGHAGDRPLHQVWSEKFAWLLPHFIVLGFIAFVLTIAYRSFGLYGVLGFLAPALMTRFTMKQYVDRTERTVTELRQQNAKVQRLSDQLAEAYDTTLSAFVSALDMRDAETHGHSERVAAMSLELGARLGILAGSQEWVDLRNGALLHDVGKIGVPDAILRKPESLDMQEWESIRTHPAHGHKMLSGVGFLAGAAELVLCHHERFDGKGYPRGLSGDAIPLGARIFAVADTFDAITSRRPYKAARSPAEAIAEIVRNSGTQFDPQVVEALLTIRTRIARAA